MFILNHKLNVELDQKELAEIECYAEKCGLDIEGVLFLRNNGLTWNGNVACFSMMYKNTVFFCGDAPIFRAFPAIAHELKHREQLKRIGFVKYAILANPLCRKWTIEPEAYAEQDRINLELA